MAAGVKTFSSKGREVRKFEFVPPTPGEYDAMLRTDKVDVKVAQGAGKLPYVSGMIELLNTATQEGGKNKSVFHTFFLDLSPSPKDGVSMVERQGGLIEFARSVGQELEGIAVETKKKAEKDGTGAETGNFVNADVLNSQQVVRWLKQFDGVVFKCRTKIEKDLQGNPRGKISYFIEAEEQQESGEMETLGEDVPADLPADEDNNLEAMPEIDEVPPARPAAKRNGVAQPRPAVVTQMRKPTARPPARR